MIGYGESVAGRAYRTWRRFPVETMQKLKAHLEAGEVNPHVGDVCYVGWAVRDALRTQAVDRFLGKHAVHLFGGHEVDWWEVYRGVSYTSPFSAPYIQSFELAMRDTLANANR